MDIRPIKMRDSLPTVPVPLLAGENDVPLDLESAFSTCMTYSDMLSRSITVGRRRFRFPNLTRHGRSN